MEGMEEKEPSIVPAEHPQDKTPENRAAPLEPAAGDGPDQVPPESAVGDAVAGLSVAEPRGDAGADETAVDHTAAAHHSTAADPGNNDEASGESAAATTAASAAAAEPAGPPDHGAAGAAAPAAAVAVGPWCELVTDASSGLRYLVAVKHVPMGTVLFEEKALVVSPAYVALNPFMKEVSCPSCCGRLSHSLPMYWPVCGGCSLPLCSEACKERLGAASLHSDRECRLLRKGNIRGKFLPNERLLILGPLRVLLAPPEVRAALDGLPSKIVGAGLFEILDDMLTRVKYTCGSRFSDEEITFAYGVLQINSFQYDMKSTNTWCAAVLEKTSLAEHSCRPNTRAIPTGESQLDVRLSLLATQDLAAGQRLTLGTMDPWKRTLFRQQAMREDKNWVCHCERCEDPTELGLHYGSICCLRCKKRGAPMSVLEMKGLDMEADCVCPACGFVMKHLQVLISTAKLERELGDDQGSGDPAVLESLLKRVSYPRGFLHPTSSIVVHAKMNILLTQGNFPGYVYADMSDAQLARRVELCREMLPVATVIAPGLSEQRAMVLENLVCSRAEQCRRALRAAELDLAREILTEVEPVNDELQAILVERCEQEEMQKIRDAVKELKELCKGGEGN